MSAITCCRTSWGNTHSQEQNRNRNTVSKQALLGDGGRGDTTRFLRKGPGDDHTGRERRACRKAANDWRYAPSHGTCSLRPQEGRGPGAELLLGTRRGEPAGKPALPGLLRNLRRRRTVVPTGGWRVPKGRRYAGCLLASWVSRACLKQVGACREAANAQWAAGETPGQGLRPTPSRLEADPKHHCFKKLVCIWMSLSLGAVLGRCAQGGRKPL